MSNLSKATISVEKYRTLIETDDHHFIVDEPLDLGGGDLGPNPGELLSAALAACTTITIKMYAERKEWKLDEVKVEVEAKIVALGRELTREESLDISAKKVRAYNDRMLIFAAAQIAVKVK